MTTTSLSPLAEMSSGWIDLDLADAYIVDRAYARTQRLMRHDETVQMLSEKSILVLLSALYFEDSGLVNNARLTVYGADQIGPRVRHAIRFSALHIVNDAFADHVAELVVHAIFPEQVPGRAE